MGSSQMEKAQGLLLRGVDFSETSRVVTFFTRELGKISALAKGGRRVKSSFDLSLDTLSLCQIGLIRKPNAELDLLTDAMLLERFMGLRTSLDALYAAYYLAELLDMLVKEHDPHEQLFDESIKTLKALADGVSAVPAIIRFRLILLRELGLGLVLEACAQCGKEVVGNKVLVVLQLGGVVCRSCRHADQNGILMQVSSAKASSQLVSTEPKDLSGIRLALSTCRELAAMSRLAIEQYLNRRPRSADLFEELLESFLKKRSAEERQKSSPPNE